MSVVVAFDLALIVPLLDFWQVSKEKQWNQSLSFWSHIRAFDNQTPQERKLGSKLKIFPSLFEQIVLSVWRMKASRHMAKEEIAPNTKKKYAFPSSSREETWKKKSVKEERRHEPFPLIRRHSPTVWYWLGYFSTASNHVRLYDTWCVNESWS